MSNLGGSSGLGAGRPIVLALLWLSSAWAIRAGENVLPIVERAFAAAEANQKIQQLSVFHERVEQRVLDKQGREKSRESKTWDVTLLDGSVYKQLIAKDDQPLSEKEQAKQQRKLDKQLRKMRDETPAQREKRLEKIAKEREEARRFLEEITRAFDFQLIGEETIDGVDTHVISAQPRAGYEPAFRQARVLTKLRGTLWISTGDHAWVRAEIETFEDFKWRLVKLREGATIRFSQQRVNDEVWMMDNWFVRLRAKAALVFGFHGEFTGTYDAFRKFTTDDSEVYEGAPR